MNDLEWVKTASNHAMISKAELLQWLSIGQKDLPPLIADQGFPEPRIKQISRSCIPVGKRKYTASCRWRVGDVRAWLAGKSLENEKKIQIGAEATVNQKAAISMDHIFGRH